MDKLDKWLYFRTVADAANDDGDTGSEIIYPSSLCVPASSMVSIAPSSDTAVIMTFNSVRIPHGTDTWRQTNDARPHDTVILNVTQGKTFEVMQAIVQTINSSKRNDDGFLVIADDCVTTDSATSALADLTILPQYVHADITSVGAITANNTAGEYGIHELFEVVAPMTADDNDVAGSLTVKLPAQAVLIQAALIPIALAGSNHGALDLEYHNAAIADDAASGGTEWVGADTSGDTSIPDADCDLDATAGVLGKGVWSGSAATVARGTAETFFHVCAKEDLSSMTGTPKVGVYIKWLGYRATKITA